VLQNGLFVKTVAFLFTQHATGLACFQREFIRQEIFEVEEGPQGPYIK